MYVEFVDLYSGRFWGIVALALLVLVPLKGAVPRKWAFSLINATFLGLYLGATAIWVLGGVALVLLALRLIEWRRLRGAALALAGSAALGLFILHKLPGVGAGYGLARINPVLTLVGYSYLALRLVEVGRAVHEGRHPAPDFPGLVNYLLPFHMLSAGPIQAYDDFAAQPGTPPALDAREALGGVERIAAGLFKKYVLASTIERVFLTGFRAGGPYFWLEVQLNYVWLFLDFSAYSDVAVGIGRLMGVATPENFNRPYLARNIIDYWDRWHISLSLFIRRNIFIPIQLALMRRTDGRRPLLVASLAFTISFLLCGLWHAISWRLLAWGAIQAAGLVACNLYRHQLTKRIGRKGMARYLANPWVRAVMVVVTFEFIALAMAVQFAGWDVTASK